MTVFSINYRNKHSWLLFWILFAMVGSLLACGSGGDSSTGSAASPTAPAYTGNTSAAALSSDNAKTLIRESYQGALIGQTAASLAAVVRNGQADDVKTLSNPLALNLQNAFALSLTDIIENSKNLHPDSEEKTVTVSDRLNSQCGGSATYSVNIDESSGMFSGSVSYEAFCSGQITLSGHVSLSGLVDVSTFSFEYFSVAYSNLTTAADGLTWSVNGTLECDFQGNDMIITTDMVMKQSAGGAVCWLNDYTIQISSNHMEISGRFYDPILGYVDFVTTAPLVLTDAGAMPVAGTIEYTGGVGISGLQTRAQLDAVSSDTCRVTVDSDGDGDNDYDSETISWREL